MEMSLEMSRAAEKKLAAYNRRYDAQQCRAFARSPAEKALLQAGIKAVREGQAECAMGSQRIVMMLLELTGLDGEVEPLGPFEYFSIGTADVLAMRQVMSKDFEEHIIQFGDARDTLRISIL